jgi:hypothetical protein
MAVVHGADSDPEEEIVDGEVVEHAGVPLPSAAEPRALPLEDRPAQGLDWARTPAVQSAFAAATGFVAGAATLALMRRYGVAKLERALTATPDEPLLAPGAALGPGRTYIVHVRPLRTIGPGSSGE